MLAREVIDLTYLQWLYPSGIEQPSFDTLAGGIAADDESFTVGGRLELIPRDTVVEIDSELILLNSVSGVLAAVQERGYLGSTATTHSDGARVVIDPRYSRHAVLNALNAIVGMLYAWGLHARLTDENTVFSTNELLDLPAGGEEIVSILVRENTQEERWRPLKRRHWELFDEFDPPKYRLFQGGSEDDEMRVTYLGDFSEVTSEDDNLNTGGVPTRIQPFLPMAVAGYLLQGQELSRLQIEEIRNQLAAEGIQAGVTLNIGQTMLRVFKSEYVLAERQRQRRKDRLSIEVVRD